MATKTWRMAADIDPNAAVAVSFILDGSRQPVDNIGTLAAAEILVASIAVCFASSCQITMDARSLPRASISVDVLAIKAPDRPNRVASVTIHVEISADLELRTYDRILRDAKRICTVSNSLSPDIVIDVSRAHADGPA
ncbi:MAG: OsmC family protein [Hyphomicrobiales bacterium]|nr:OsmC family protein [Hyphomicrobiales bacterium]